MVGIGQESLHSGVSHDKARFLFFGAAQPVDGHDRAAVEQLLVGLISNDFDFSDEVFAVFRSSKPHHDEVKQFTIVITMQMEKEFRIAIQNFADPN